MEEEQLKQVSMKFSKATDDKSIELRGFINEGQLRTWTSFSGRSLQHVVNSNSIKYKNGT